MTRQQSARLMLSFAILVGVVLAANLSNVHGAWGDTPSIVDWLVPVILAGIGGIVLLIVIIWYLDRHQKLQHARKKIQLATTG